MTGTIKNLKVGLSDYKFNYTLHQYISENIRIFKGLFSENELKFTSRYCTIEYVYVYWYWQLQTCKIVGWILRVTEKKSYDLREITWLVYPSEIADMITWTVNDTLLFKGVSAESIRENALRRWLKCTYLVCLSMVADIVLWCKGWSLID